ncbi:MAG: hypothetical protein KC492_20335, partial [Myxococcales bacterium]|nr:hypothetical protein [Myxococcales bacterium]
AAVPSVPSSVQLAAEVAESAALRRHGRLSYAERAELRTQALTDVVAPCLKALLSQPRTLEQPSAAV